MPENTQNLWQAWGFFEILKSKPGCSIWSSDPDWQLSNGLVMVSGSGKLLCPLPKFSLLSNLLLSSSWSGVESKSQCQKHKQLGAYLTWCQFFSLMYSLWAPSLKLTLKGSSSLLSSLCLSSLPDVSSGGDWGARDQDNNEQRLGGRNMSRKYERTLHRRGDFTKLSQTFDRSRAKKLQTVYTTHARSRSIQLILQILLCRENLESFVQCGKKLNDL